MVSRKNYSAIFLLFYTLICTVVGYGINRPHRRDFPVAHTDDDNNSENLLVTGVQHPRERRSIPLYHGGARFADGSELNVLRNDANFGGFEPSSEESTAAIFQHTRRMRPALRLNGNVLDTEVNLPDPNHPWRLEGPHRRHGFHHSRHYKATYGTDSDESSEETEQTGNRRRFNEESEQSSKGSTGTATVTFHRTINIVPSPRLVGNALDTEVGATDPYHPWRVQWPQRRHRFHHLRWHGVHLEPGTDELSGEDEQPHATNGNSWLKPHNRNEDSQGKENEKDPSVTDINTSTILVETTTSRRSDETTVTRATEKSIAIDETTTTVPKIYETTTTKIYDTSIFDTTAADTIGIDIRGGFA